jgi:hypothetical protein
MSLVKDDLKKGFVKAFQDGMKLDDDDGGKSPPAVHSKVAKALASAYDSYANAAVAGELSISVPGQVSLLEEGFATSMFVGVGPSILSYWTPVIWEGTGFIPANPMAPSSLTALASIAPDIVTLISQNAGSIEDFAGDLASILHKYTSKLQVTATTLPPASAVSTIPVT